MLNIRSAVDRALSMREAIVGKFQVCLAEDIEEVRNQIKAVKQHSQVNDKKQKNKRNMAYNVYYIPPTNIG